MIEYSEPINKVYYNTSPFPKLGSQVRSAFLNPVRHGRQRPHLRHTGYGLVQEDDCARNTVCWARYDSSPALVPLPLPVSGYTPDGRRISDRSG